MSDTQDGQANDIVNDQESASVESAEHADSSTQTDHADRRRMSLDASGDDS